MTALFVGDARAASAASRSERPQRVQNDCNVDDSCTIAAGTGSSQPTSAATIANNDNPMPTVIRRARCAIMIASPTRSSRSAKITTSAASDEALAPRAERSSDIGHGQRCGVIDAIADHDGRM